MRLLQSFMNIEKIIFKEQTSALRTSIQDATNINAKNNN